MKTMDCYRWYPVKHGIYQSININVFHMIVDMILNIYMFKAEGQMSTELHHLTKLWISYQLAG